jgi:FkbM family methyltransferase
MHFMLRYLRSADNFLDVGANVGVYAVLASSIVTSGEIHVFEPSSQALLRLKENIRINGLPNVRIHAVAVSDSSGNVYLTQKKDTMNHLVHAGNLQDVEVVTSVKLQDEVGGINFTMGKMDIEGAELLAMKGAVRMLEARNPPVWLLEANDLSRRFGYAKGELIGFLEKYGYGPAAYNVDDNCLRMDKNGWRTKQNIIMVSETHWGEVENRIAWDSHNKGLLEAVGV